MCKKLSSNGNVMPRELTDAAFSVCFGFSVIFQNEAVGEFWYDLRLKATTPLPVNLPSVHCELGK